MKSTLLAVFLLWQAISARPCPGFQPLKGTDAAGQMFVIDTILPVGVSGPVQQAHFRIRSLNSRDCLL